MSRAEASRRSSQAVQPADVGTDLRFNGHRHDRRVGPGNRCRPAPNAIRNLITQDFPTVPLDHSGKVGDTWDMARSSTLTRKTDSKGRITLGESLANRTMIVEQHGDEIVLRLARVIPEREAWLYDNKQALASLRRGLKQAKAGRFARKGPDLEAAAELADQLQDD